MPIKNAKYAMKKTSKGNVRLAFINGKVTEAKNMKTGKTHTTAEFKADAKKTKEGKKHEGMETKKMKLTEKKMSKKS